MKSFSETQKDIHRRRIALDALQTLEFYGLGSYCISDAIIELQTMIQGSENWIDIQWNAAMEPVKNATRDTTES